MRRLRALARLLVRAVERFLSSDGPLRWEPRPRPRPDPLAALTADEIAGSLLAVAAVEAALKGRDDVLREIVRGAEPAELAAAFCCLVGLHSGALEDVYPDPDRYIAEARAMITEL